MPPVQGRKGRSGAVDPAVIRAGIPGGIRDFIFPENIEARVNGPVLRRPCDARREKFRLPRLLDGQPEAPTDLQRDTVDAVPGFHGDKPWRWPGDLTRMETPWRSARRGIPDGERGRQVIPKEGVAWHCGSLQRRSWPEGGGSPAKARALPPASQWSRRAAPGGNPAHGDHAAILWAFGIADLDGPWGCTGAAGGGRTSCPGFSASNR